MKKGSGGGARAREDQGIRGGRKICSWEERRLKAREMEQDIGKSLRDRVRSKIFAV